MQRWRVLWGLLLTSLFTLEALWNIPSLVAQNEPGVGLSIVPAIVELPLAANDTFKITVTNITDESLPVSVGVRALIPIDPNVDSRLRQRYDASQWIVPEAASLVLQAAEAKTIAFKVDPPTDPGPGGHYALVVFRILTPEAATEATNARVNPEITSVVMLTIPGDINEAGELSVVQPSRWQWPPQRQLAFDFINRGNLHLLPQNRIVILSVSGQVVETLPVASHLVLPGTASRFSVDWRPSKWGLYRYKIESSFGTPLKLFEADSQIFMVWPPVWIQIIGVASLIGLGFLTKRAVKYLRRRLRRARRLAVDRVHDGQHLTKVDPAKLDVISRSDDVRDVARRSRRKP